MDRVDAKCVIPAAKLYNLDGSGRSLAVEALSGGSSSGSGGGSAGGIILGSGAFGKVGKYRYSGAQVAVKELKAEADEESIGVTCTLTN